MRKIIVILLVLVAGGSLDAQGAEYVFQPKGSEFSVTFPSKPSIVPVSVTDAGKRQTGTRAELIGSTWILKAEVAPIQKGSADAMRDEDLVAGAQRYAEYNGLEHAEVSLIPSKIARCVRFRAFKDINGTIATYENHFCYGDTSLIILYVSSASKNYPPPPAIPFLKSLKRL